MAHLQRRQHNFLNRHITVVVDRLPCNLFMPNLFSVGDKRYVTTGRFLYRSKCHHVFKHIVYYETSRLNFFFRLFESFFKMNIKALCDFMQTYGETLVKEKIVQIDWDALYAFRMKHAINWRLLPDIGNYVSRATFVQLRCVCRNTKNLFRTRCVEELNIGRYSWQQVRSMIGPVKKIPILSIAVSLQQLLTNTDCGFFQSELTPEI